MEIIRVQGDGFGGGRGGVDEGVGLCGYGGLSLNDAYNRYLDVCLRKTSEVNPCTLFQFARGGGICDDVSSGLLCARGDVGVRGGGSYEDGSAGGDGQRDRDLRVGVSDSVDGVGLSDEGGRVSDRFDGGVIPGMLTGPNGGRSYGRGPQYERNKKNREEKRKRKKEERERKVNSVLTSSGNAEAVVRIPTELRETWVERKRLENLLAIERSTRLLALEKESNARVSVSEALDSGAGSPRPSLGEVPTCRSCVPRTAAELEKADEAARASIRESRVRIEEADLKLARLRKRVAEGEVDRQVAIEKRFQEKQLDGSISLQPSRYVSGWAKTVRSQSSKGSTNKSLGLDSSASGGTTESSVDISIFEAVQARVVELEKMEKEKEMKIRKEREKWKTEKGILVHKNRMLEVENRDLKSSGSYY